MPTSRSSTMSSRPTPWAPARRFSSSIACSIVTCRPSIDVGTPSVKPMVTSSGSRGTARLTGHGRVLGVLVDVLDGAVPDVLQEAGLDGPAPHVLVDRVRGLLR